jgi:hypothetical protein
MKNNHLEIIKDCPFCGSKLVYFGRDLREGKVLKVYKHPEYKHICFRCPLSSLIFSLKDWNHRKNKMIVNLDNYKSENTVTFSGRERGRSVRKKIGGSNLDQATEIKFIIPDDVYAIASSFILGLLGQTIRSLKNAGRNPEDVIKIPEGFELTFKEAFRQAIQTEYPY